MPTSDPAVSAAWPGPCLMVPVTVDVLLVGDADRDSVTTWAVTRTSYYNLATAQLPTAAPPFAERTRDARPQVGAHLLWTLPYGLRHGAQSPDGSRVDFPAVPNRWLVTRMAWPAGGAAPRLTAVVVQSDRLSPLGDFPERVPQFPDPDGAGDPVARIGGATALAAWTGALTPDGPVLTAVGPGDVSWAVAYDNVAGVFGLFDDVADLPATPLTYQVTGWYADPARDVLYGYPTDDPSVWQAQVEEQLGWSVGGTLQDVQDARAAWAAWAAARALGGGAPDPSLAPQLREAMERWRAWQAGQGIAGPQPELPRQTLLHGTTQNVQWLGRARAYGTGVPGGGTPPDVAVGNTPSEAISAYLARLCVDRFGGGPDDADALERALEAFQKDLLWDLQKDPVKTEAQLHQARFGSVPAGEQWIVVRPQGNASDSAWGGQQTVPLTPAQTAALTRLNGAQSSLNAAGATLATQRRELYALAMKQQNLAALPARRRKQLAALIDRVNRAQAAVRDAAADTRARAAALAEQVETERAGLAALLDPAAFELRHADLAPAWAPTDPVVMIGRAGQDAKLLPPGAFGDDDQTLFARFTGQTITGVTVRYDAGTGARSETLTPGGLLDAVTLPAGSFIPKEVADLWVEAVFLDPSAAPLLAALWFSQAGVDPTPGQTAEVVKLIRDQQAAVFAPAAAMGVDARAVAAAAGMVGVPPSHWAVEVRTGQPWTPIYMDWQVSWFPTPGDPLQSWALGDIDYEWLGDFVVPPPPAPLYFYGRTVVNARGAQAVRDKFRTFENDPSYDQLPDFVLRNLRHVAGMVGRMDLLTQSLSGFTDQLVTVLGAMTRAPADPALQALLGDAPTQFAPVTGPPGDDGPTPEPPQPFFPLRAGHLQLIDLWVVDSFGQVMRGKDPSLGPNAPIPTPVRAASVATADPAGQPDANAAFVQLAPRVSQTSRVELRFLKADDDTVPSNSSDLTTPICGWVMPNHLDDSLSVFDAAGNALGSVIRVQRSVSQAGVTTGARWDAAPGSDAPLGATPVLPNAHLQAFIDALLRRAMTSAGAFDDLLDAIDASLWAVGMGNPREGNLSVLAGQALAVVRADVSLSLAGLPDYNQTYGLTGQYYLDENGAYRPVPPPWTSTALTVRVGDLAYRGNGVLGYFQADAYDTFYAVHGAGPHTSALRRALKGGPLAPGAAARLVARSAASPSGFGSGYVVPGHLVRLWPDGGRVPLTLLVDPRGEVPVISGSTPLGTQTLAPGPVTAALQNMRLTFRVGPVLTDPGTLRMPLPAQVRGEWGWMARTDVTHWGPEAGVRAQSPVAEIGDSPRILSEGWLTLTGATLQDVKP